MADRKLPTKQLSRIDHLGLQKRALEPFSNKFAEALLLNNPDENQHFRDSIYNFLA
jgi:hypothetical protein